MMGYVSLLCAMHILRSFVTMGTRENVCLYVCMYVCLSVCVSSTAHKLQPIYMKFSTQNQCHPRTTPIDFDLNRMTPRLKGQRSRQILTQHHGFKFHHSTLPTKIKRFTKFQQKKLIHIDTRGR